MKYLVKAMCFSISMLQAMEIRNTPQGFIIFNKHGHLMAAYNHKGEIVVVTGEYFERIHTSDSDPISPTLLKKLEKCTLDTQ